MKLPNFKKLCKLRLPSPRPKPRRLEATARRVPASAMDEYDDCEPTTKISTALIVVLILHVVAIGGIYAFNQVKYVRQSEDGLAPKNSAQKPAPAEGATAPVSPSIASSAPAPSIAAATPALSIMPLSGSKVYHVKAGDTLSKIATANGVSAIDLETFNGLKETSTLHGGQILNIPPVKIVARSTAGDPHKSEIKKDDAAVKTSSVAGSKTYTVKKGDNPVNIARSLNVSYDELLKINKVDDPKKLQIGTVLKIPPAKKSKPDPEHL